MRVLIAGESWVTHSIHQKGFDSFTTTSYHKGVGPLRAALESGGVDVEYLPNHLAAAQFPIDLPWLTRYDVVLLSDIGANTLLLHPDTFDRSLPLPNRLELLRDWVHSGGGLIMIGGYLTFSGIEGKARYAGTAVEEALPVAISTVDDRVESPQGKPGRVVVPGHPIVAGLPLDWPLLLGYNRVSVKPGATLVARAGADPCWSPGRSEADARWPSRRIAARTGHPLRLSPGPATRACGGRW